MNQVKRTAPITGCVSLRVSILEKLFSAYVHQLVFIEELANDWGFPEHEHDVISTNQWFDVW